MDINRPEQLALHRFGVIAEALDEHLSPAERGEVVRAIAQRRHGHPDGSSRRYSRSTIDRFIRAHRSDGLAGLHPVPRSDTGQLRAHPELFSEAAALRLELPSRSAAQIASILYHRHGIKVAERTVRAQLARRGLQREALLAEPKAFGRYEAERSNERWITDVLVGPYVPFPRKDASVRARLFLIVDDHSRLLVEGRFFAHENARSAQECLRSAIVHRGVPAVLYAVVVGTGSYGRISAARWAFPRSGESLTFEAIPTIVRQCHQYRGARKVCSERGGIAADPRDRSAERGAA